MNLLIKNINLNINKSYFENSKYSIKDFYAFKDVRNNIILNILSETLVIQDFEILLLISKDENLYIDIKISIIDIKIIRFINKENAISFYLYIKNDTNLSNNYSLYFFNNNYYFIFNNLNINHLKLIDFESITYSPLIYARIVENGFKLNP